MSRPAAKRSIALSLADAALSAWPPIIGTAGFLLTAIGFVVAPEATIQVKWFWAFAVAAMFVLWIVLDALRRALQSVPVLPKVITSVIEPGREYPVLLIDPSELYGSSTLVSIFYRNPDSDFEVSVGRGFVRHIQGDGKVQIEIEVWAVGNDGVLAGLRQASSRILDRTIVRPSVLREPRETTQGELARLFLAGAGARAEAYPADEDDK
jgi:hypothetical protein